MSTKAMPDIDRKKLIAYYYKCLPGLCNNAVKLYCSNDKMQAAIIYKREDNTFGIEELHLELYDEEEREYAHDYGDWEPCGNGVSIYDTAETAIKESGHILSDMQEVDLTSSASKAVRKLTVIRKKRLVSAFIKETFKIDGKKYQIKNGETVEIDIDDDMHILSSPYSSEFIDAGLKDITVYIKCKFSLIWGNKFEFVKND